MKPTLPLSEMTTDEKLGVIEDIWADLIKNPKSVPAPAWHGDVLAARELRIQNGTARFIPLEDVKEKLLGP